MRKEPVRAADRLFLLSRTAGVTARGRQPEAQEIPSALRTAEPSSWGMPSIFRASAGVAGRLPVWS